jgi:protease-4
VTRRSKGFLLALIGLGAVVAIITLAVVLSRGVERGTIIELTLSGTIAEERDTTLNGKLFQGEVTLVGEVRALFEKARRDDNVDGILAVIKPCDVGPAKIQEIREAVKAFRESGKWAVAYLETAGEMYAGNWNYMLASAFEDLTLAPAGDINLAGVMATVPFFRGTLDKIGILPDFDHIGEYKNAKNVYTEKGFTKAHREATLALVEDLQAAMVEAISESRGMSPAEVEALIDRGPFTGEDALEEGLVDRLAYYDEFLEAAEERAGGPLRTLDWEEYLDRRQGLGVGRHKIAVIHGTGLIHRGRSGYDPSIGMHMGSDSVAEAIRQARKDDSVKAIILRIDSPGGSALASDVVWRETQLAKERKPVVASFSDLAASGGYYVACGADRIVSEPATLTGSIGVVYGKFVKKGFYDWIGLNYGEIKVGEHADFWSDLHAWTPEEKEQYYWKFVRKIYDQFVTRVAEGRQMTPEAVDRIGRGRVWTGRRAMELGLVDELGGFGTAVRVAKELAQIPEDEDVRFVVLPEKPSFWDSLWGWGAAPANLPPGVQAIVKDLQPLGRAAFFDGQAVLLMPFEISVQ